MRNSYTASYLDLNGSIISYQPPDNTKYVIYNFHYLYSTNHTHAISHHRLYLNSNEVTKARYSLSSNITPEQLTNFQWSFAIGGSADATSGRVATWTSPLEIKMQIRAYSGSHTGRFHGTYYWDGSSSPVQFHQPQIGIKAIGSLS